MYYTSKAAYVWLKGALMVSLVINQNQKKLMVYTQSFKKCIKTVEEVVNRETVSALLNNTLQTNCTAVKPPTFGHNTAPVFISPLLVLELQCSLSERPLDLGPEEAL